MNFFNIDMHISIIHDVKNILENQGHTVESYCMSGHTWVNNELPKTPLVINQHNWQNIDQKMCDDFYDAYKNKLDHIDAFIHSYPPAFSLLFEKFNKPIITIACTRFDYPCLDEHRLEWLICGLKRLYSKKLLVPVANNLFDKKVCEEYTGFEWQYISSLCNYMKGGEYTDYNNTTGKFITWSRSNMQFNHPLIDNRFTIATNYDRMKLSKNSGIIHVPYNISIMSFFEHYMCNIPLFVPAPSLIEKWVKHDKYNILNELYFKGSSLKFKKEWLDLSDWYNNDYMPFVTIFSSNDELYNIISSQNISTLLNDTTAKMKNKNEQRVSEINKQWSSLINQL